jgi:uncharacterized membrane protein
MKRANDVKGHLGMLELPSSKLRRIALFTLAFFFALAGVGHFTNEAFFVSIMPPYLPAHRFLVYLSGVFEFLGAVAALVPATRSYAGYALIALLIAVFPANIHMAMNPELFVTEGSPAWGLYARLPVQLLFMYWAWWATRPDPMEA